MQDAGCRGQRSDDGRLLAVEAIGSDAPRPAPTPSPGTRWPFVRPVLAPWEPACGATKLSVGRVTKIGTDDPGLVRWGSRCLCFSVSLPEI